MRFNPGRFEAFFELLPRDTEAALGSPAGTTRASRRAPGCATPQRPLRHAVEIRHESFRDAAFVALLRATSIALVVRRHRRRGRSSMDVTADFVYLRLHGDEELYVSGYDDDALDTLGGADRRLGAGGEPDDAGAVKRRPPRAPRGPRRLCLLRQRREDPRP